MIIDIETDKLYLADSLQKAKYKPFLDSFIEKLTHLKIPYNFLPNTKDIWAVDYMPIQISKDKFVQFKYNPDYLQSTTYLKTISDVDLICEQLNIKTIKSNIIIDGGNVIKAQNKVIMCDKVFHENQNISEKDLIKELKNLFEIEYLYFIPWDKKSDKIGHADGMVRFIDENTVLINDLSKDKDKEYQRSFRMALNNAKLDWNELPYNPYENKSLLCAKGIYLNYLQMKQGILVPIFEQNEDDKSIEVLSNIFKSTTIIPINSNEIAKDGGILNCISWNIKNS